MKKNNFKWHVVTAATGFLLFATGIVLIILFSDSAQGIMKTLPFIILGIGIGLLGGGISNVITSMKTRKNPNLAKQMEIDTKDERNISIGNMAKAKIFDLMLMFFSLLIMFLAVMEVGKLVIFVFVGAYILIIASFVYLLSKYHKEM